MSIANTGNELRGMAMRYSKPVSIFVLIFFLFLSGCWMDGSGAVTSYDGDWTLLINAPSTIPASNPTGGVSVSCLQVGPKIHLAYGSGSATVRQTCTVTTTTINATTNASTVTVRDEITDFVTSVSIASGGVTNAIVNGNALTGQCISINGCAAQSATINLGLTR